MSVHDGPLVTDPPRAGPARVEWWRQLERAIAHEILWTAQQLRDAGWSEDAIDDVIAVAKAWVLALVTDALAEGETLRRWAA